MTLIAIPDLSDPTFWQVLQYSPLTTAFYLMDVRIDAVSDSAQALTSAQILKLKLAKILMPKVFPCL